MHVLCPPLLIANNKYPDENLLQQLPLRHSSGTLFVSSPKYSSRIGPADRGTQPQHQSRRTMHAKTARDKSKGQRCWWGKWGLIRLSGVNNKRSQKRSARCRYSRCARCRLSVLEKTGGGGGSANEDGERRKRTALCCRQTATQKRVEGDLREEGSRVRDNKSTNKQICIADSAQIERLDSIPSRCTTE